MLYKKVHRQHVREFRVGRKYKFFGRGVHEVTGKPYIVGSCIRVVLDRLSHYTLIYMTGEYSGKLLQAHKITWIS